MHTLYPPAFGTVGAFFEVGAVVLAAVLAFLVRHRQPAFGWTLLGALCLVSSHAAFWIWIVPVNLTMLSLTPETLPADWMRLRAQWGYTHAVRAVLQTAALGALVFSILIETPTHASGNQSA
ncbi:MAG: anthrone oxygenase family protein [Methylobacter sp.]